jgi:hypothetical protein
MRAKSLILVAQRRSEVREVLRLINGPRELIESGLFLSTQFWDTYTGLESQGQKYPADSWTLHGLW